uniref:RNase H family protein n=2 Tax=Solanum tuberosum TaxID=4113 RepID=M1BVH0_SOLTU
MFICWELWRSRCNHKYETIKPSVYRSKRNITNILFFTLQSNFDRIKVENSWENINQIFDVSINHKNAIRVNWIRLPTMFAKLNTNGSCVNGRCGGGGILRNALGQVIMAFTINLGEGTSSWAEAMSMLHGMQLCIQRGVNMIIGETDSILLAKAITKSWSIPWRMYIPVKKIQKIVEEHGFTINHCLREANQPANKLASISLSTDVNQVFNSYTNLPSLVKGLVNLDRMNLPTFRSKRTKDANLIFEPP